MDSDSHPTKLAAWLASAKVGKAGFAKKCGITPSHLSNLLAGVRGTSYATAERIATATGGVVAIADLIGPANARAVSERRRQAVEAAALRPSWSARCCRTRSSRRAGRRLPSMRARKLSA